MDHEIKRIVSVEKDSIADELGIEAGDCLVSINGSAVTDIFDYMFLSEDEDLDVVIRKPDGEEWLFEIEKDEDEKLGLVFGNGLMDDYRSCRNKCIFCFIDQMPPGMRETLYFKDDDSRLSFLQGNYVTLTNMSNEDIDRVIKYNMSPINISFHAMDPALRCKMLHNRFAGDVYEKAKRLADGGIEMNGQIVLCRDVNDKENLEHSLEVLYTLRPMLRSVSVVPVGLTKYRDGLFPLEPFDSAGARDLLSQVRRWQEKARNDGGSGFVYASDEWYLLAGEAIPPGEQYDGYPQLENGVGMLRLLEEEISEYLEGVEGDDRKVRLSIATGYLAGGFIGSMVKKIRQKFGNIEALVYPIRNDFFGEHITVSGLVTGQDLIAQLKGRELGERLVIPVNMLRSGEKVFLDDVTTDEVRDALNTPVVIADAPGESFCSAIIYGERKEPGKRRQVYEQADSSGCGQA